MPTIVTAEPIQPGESRTIDEAIAFGRETWQALWRPFARQWSQPGLIKLAAATLKVRALHSSQIHGWSTGKLKDPSPKLMLAIGKLNLAIARSNGAAVEADKCPGELEKLWKGYSWLTNPDGSPMGPEDVVMTLMGQVDHCIDNSRQIPREQEEEVCRALAKDLRLTLAKDGIDWLDEVGRLSKFSVIAEDTLMGKTIPADLLIRELDNLGKMVNKSGDQLWNESIADLVELTA